MKRVNGVEVKKTGQEQLVFRGYLAEGMESKYFEIAFDNINKGKNLDILHSKFNRKFRIKSSLWMVLFIRASSR